MLRVGLTGGIGSGKSAVTDLLCELGALVIDADELAREVVAPGTEGLAEVVAEFGSEVVGANGGLDRPAMARLAFGDEAARRRLEAIIHPRVRRRAAQIEASADPDAVVVHAIPLLVETGQTDRFDRVLVVDVPVDVQRRRLLDNRELSPAAVDARIEAQASREQRLAVADIVVDNSGPPDDLRKRVHEVFEQLRAVS